MWLGHHETDRVTVKPRPTLRLTARRRQRFTPRSVLQEKETLLQGQVGHSFLLKQGQEKRLGCTEPELQGSRLQLRLRKHFPGQGCPEGKEPLCKWMTLMLLVTPPAACLRLASMAHPGSYLKVGVVVIRVFRLPHLHLHSRLLHELAGGQGHGPQHVLSAALEHLLQDLAGHKAGNIMASSGRAMSYPVRKGESTSTPRGWHHPEPCPCPPITPPASSCWKSGRCSPFRAILLQGGLREPTQPIREGLRPEESQA